MKLHRCMKMIWLFLKEVDNKDELTLPLFLLIVLLSEKNWNNEMKLLI